MRFFAPAGLAFLGVLVPIIILYILRLRRRTQVVSTVAIWDRVFKREVQSALWRKIKRIISLILHLAIAAIIALAIARPVLSDKLVPQRVVVVLDASASMTAGLGAAPLARIIASPNGAAMTSDEESGALRGERTRFEAAIDLVRAQVLDLSVEDRMMIVRSGPRPEVLAPMTGEKEALLRALDLARPGQAEGDLRAAIELAFAACRSEQALVELGRPDDGAATDAPREGDPEFEVLVLSDGAAGSLAARVLATEEGGGAGEDAGAAGDDPPDAPPAAAPVDVLGPEPLAELVPERTRVVYVPLGSARAPNLAVTAFSARRLPRAVGDLTQVSADFEVLVTVENFGDTEAVAQCEIHLDGVLFDPIGERVFPPGEEVSLPVRTLTLRHGGVLEMRLESEGDALAADDRAFAVIPEVEPASVLLVQAVPDLFLSNALANDTDVRVEGLDPGGWPPSKTYDVTIFEGWIPEKLPPGNLVLIAPRGKSNPFDIEESFDAPVIKDWDREHPLLSYVVLEDVVFLKAQRIDALPKTGGWSRIAEAFRGPLVLVSDDARRRIAYFSFAFTETDLVLRPSFPILVSNLVQWLREKGQRSQEESVPTGSIARVRMAADEPPEEPPGEAGEETEPTLVGVEEPVTVVRPDGTLDSLVATDGTTLLTQTEQTGIYVFIPGRPGEVEIWERARAGGSSSDERLAAMRAVTDLGSIGFLRAVLEARFDEVEEGGDGAVRGRSWPSSYRFLAANLLSDRESDVGARAALGIGEVVVAEPEPRSNRELQLTLLWIVLVLLVCEWVLYNIGVF